MAVYRPSGVALIAPTGFGNSGLWLDSTTLPETGTYTILVDPQGSATGQVTVKAFAVPADATVSVTPDGAPAVVATTTPGQNAAATFTGSATQRVSVELTAGTFGTSTSNAKVSILKPDGSALSAHLAGLGPRLAARRAGRRPWGRAASAGTWCGRTPWPPWGRSANGAAATGFTNSGLFIEPVTLPTAGTYRVFVDPQSAASGQVSVKVNDVPADPVVSGAVDGSPATLSTTAPGQNAALTFSGTANRPVSIELTSSTFGTASGSAKVSLLKPDGSALVAATNFGAAGVFLDTVKLPTTGTYKVLVDPQSTNVGAVTVAVRDTTDATATSALDSGPITLETIVPGQNARLGFTAPAGERFSIELSDSTYGSSSTNAKVSVLDPNRRSAGWRRVGRRRR